MRKWIATVLLSLSLFGCGASFEDSARATVNVAGQTLEVVDREVAVAYSEAAQEALDAALSLDGYMDRMGPWDDLVDALGVVEAVLRSAEGLLNATDSFLAQEFLAVLADLVQGFVDVARVMERLGVEVPEELLDFVDMAEGLLGRQ